MNHNWSYWYHNWPYRYTDYSTPFIMVNRSLPVYAIADTHWMFFGFSFPRNWNRYIFFKLCEVLIVFPLPNSLPRVAFSLVNLQNVFQLISSGVNTDVSTWLLPLDLFCTYLQTYNRMANFSQSKWVFLCNLMRSLWESHCKTSQAYFRLPQSRLQVSTKHTYAHDTRPFSNSMPSNHLRTNWIGIKWQTWLRLEHTASATPSYNAHIHIKIFSPNLDKSCEWPQWPSKSWNSGKSQKIPIPEFWMFVNGCVQLQKWTGPTSN